MALSSARGKLIGVIGDEVAGLMASIIFSFYSPSFLSPPNRLLQDTCVGFLLGGIGELDKNRCSSFSSSSSSSLPLANLSS